VIVAAVGAEPHCAVVVGETPATVKATAYEPTARLVADTVKPSVVPSATFGLAGVNVPTDAGALCVTVSELCAPVSASVAVITQVPAVVVTGAA
jgi:hypothetical protein